MCVCVCEHIYSKESSIVSCRKWRKRMYRSMNANSDNKHKNYDCNKLAFYSISHLYKNNKAKAHTHTHCRKGIANIRLKPPPLYTWRNGVIYLPFLSWHEQVPYIYSNIMFIYLEEIFSGSFNESL